MRERAGSNESCDPNLQEGPPNKSTSRKGVYFYCTRTYIQENVIEVLRMEEMYKDKALL